MSDAINPDHYKRLPAEAIEIIESAIDKAPSNQDAYLQGQVLKYVLRCWNKNGIEDLKKAKWYLDRLVNSLDEYEQQKASDLQSLKDHPFGKLKTASLNSDKIPEGYRKLSDSSEEPRQLGDLRWSVAEKRYIEIGVDEIGYANRDNWAACRKVEPVVQRLTTEPPDGWRWLEVGEVIRKGDRCFISNSGSIDCLTSFGEKFNHEAHYPIIRRNRFDVGEKVVDCRAGVVFTVQHTDKQYPIVFVDGVSNGIESKHFAPYIEDAK